MNSRLLTALAMVLFAGPAWPQEGSVRPGINHSYRDADFAGWQRSFESAGREVFDRRQEIVDALMIQPGMAVADVGAGTGAFMPLLAAKVGAGGTVIAQDVAADFVRGLAARAKQEGLANVRTVQGGERDARLPPASLDLIFLCDTYHHFEYPQAMLASLRAALKPGGRLAVIDFERIAGQSSGWVMGHVRADRAIAIKEIEAAGFRQLKAHAILRQNWFVEFERLP